MRSVSKQCCLMQCSTVYYIILITALLHYYKKKKKCLIILYLREGVSTSKARYISNVIMCCPVQFSYGHPCSGTRFCCHCKFTLPEAPLASSLARTFIPLSPSHTPASFHFVSFRRHWLLAYSLFMVQLFVSASYITYTLRSLTEKKLNINLPVFFWVKCKMKYSRTSQGCTSAGFYGNCRAVFCAVASLRLALCFQPGEEGRVRTVPKGAEQKVGQHRPSPSNKVFQIEKGSRHEFLTLFQKAMMHREGAHNKTYNSHSQRCNRHHLSADTNF